MTNLPRDPLRAAMAQQMHASTNGSGAHLVNLADIVIGYATQIGDFVDATGKPVNFSALADGWTAHQTDAGWTAGDTFRLAMAVAMADCQKAIRAARDTYIEASKPKVEELEFPQAPTEADARPPLRLLEGDEPAAGGGIAE